MADPEIRKGLEGVVVDTTATSLVDGAAGRLYYRGYPIESLVRQPFAAVMNLLVFGELPNEQRTAEVEDYLWHAGRLPPDVARSLRDLAERQMRQERPGHTLQATALVHEAYLRLVGDRDVGWDGRAHFYAAAAEAIRRILIEHARRIGAKKRGGDRKREIANVADLSTDETIGEAIDIDGAIEALQQHDPRAASVAQLRFFTGLSIDETAAALNVAPSTVDREWRYARAWLLRYLQQSDETGLAS